MCVFELPTLIYKVNLVMQGLNARFLNNTQKIVLALPIRPPINIANQSHRQRALESNSLPVQPTDKTVLAMSIEHVKPALPPEYYRIGDSRIVPLLARINSRNTNLKKIRLIRSKTLVLLITIL